RLGLTQPTMGQSPELAEGKRSKLLLQIKISTTDANIILSSIEMSEFFEQVIKFTNNFTKVANILISDIQSYLNNENITIDKLVLKPKHNNEMIN
ncbi:Asp-tRNA(Asn)/Glu-tRNA(Gln) amidotransferase GatCAB subunit B, partial [Rhizobium sp. KAs_5_22]